MASVTEVLGAAFGAAILTALGSRWVANFQADRDAEQRALDRKADEEAARLADERSLRDAKRERLRRDYEDLAFAATEIQGATVQLGIVWGGDTQEAVNERVNDRLNDATKDLSRAMVRLRLEGHQDLVDAYGGLRGLWYEYTSAYAGVLAHRPEYGDMSESLTKMQSAVDRILDRVKAELAELSKPI